MSAAASAISFVWAAVMATKMPAGGGKKTKKSPKQTTTVEATLTSTPPKMIDITASSMAASKSKRRASWEGLLATSQAASDDPGEPSTSDGRKANVNYRRNYWETDVTIGKPRPAPSCSNPIGQRSMNSLSVLEIKHYVTGKHDAWPPPTDKKDYTAWDRLCPSARIGIRHLNVSEDAYHYGAFDRKSWDTQLRRMHERRRRIYKELLPRPPYENKMSDLYTYTRPAVAVSGVFTHLFLFCVAPDIVQRFYVSRKNLYILWVYATAFRVK